MPEPSPARMHAVLVDALILAGRSLAVGHEAEYLKMLDDGAERLAREDGAAPSWLDEARTALRQGEDRWKEGRDEFLAQSVLEVIPPGLSPAKRRKAVRRYLEALEAVHRDSGVDVPVWIARAREIHLGERSDPPPGGPG